MHSIVWANSRRAKHFESEEELRTQHEANITAIIFIKSELTTKFLLN